MSIRTKGRIVYPRSAGDFLNLAKKMYEKHLSDGTSSPLTGDGDYNWAVDGPMIKNCIDNHTKAEEMKRKAEELYAARDLELEKIKAIVKNSGSILKGVYAKNPKKLGDYGLVVDDSPVTKK